MVVRLLLILTAVLCAGALAACSGSGQDAEDDDPTADLTAEQRTLLVVGPNPDCAPDVTRAERESFVEDNPELSDKQLAWVCPALYPSDYLSAEEKRSLEALEDPETRTLPPPEGSESGTTTDDAS